MAVRTTALCVKGYCVRYMIGKRGRGDFGEGEERSRSAIACPHLTQTISACSDEASSEHRRGRSRVLPRQLGKL